MELVAQLYDTQPNQCRTCGRRFLATDEAREKKARHLDWHFRTNQRMAEAAKRGQSRSWYVDELVRILRSPGSMASSNKGTRSGSSRAMTQKTLRRLLSLPQQEL